MLDATKWKVSEALVSVRRLNDRIESLSEDEILAALELESGSRRRAAIIDRLISRAVRLNEIKYSTHLKEKYHGTSVLQNPLPS